MDPQFDPEALGIRNAVFWVERKNRMIESGTWPGAAGQVITEAGNETSFGSGWGTEV